jgi:Ca-activated chloride channel family protein
MKKAGIVFLALLFISGCGFSQETKQDADQQATGEEAEQQEEKADDNEGKKEDQTAEKQVMEGEKGEAVAEEDLPEVPSTYEAAVDYPLTGEFAGEAYEKNKDEIEEKLDKLPELADPYSEESREYKAYVYSLFAEGYSMPNIPIEQWDAMTLGDPGDTEDDVKQAELKENYHVAILLDSSGSMANYENDKTRMELAKESINQFVANLPEEAQVTLQVYGHKGSGSEEDKAMSCDSVETLYSLDKYQEDEFQSALDQFEPAGWTPIAKAIEEVTGEFEAFDGKQSTNIIYVVSDGEETCGGDPVKAVKALADSDIQPVVNLIGYQANKDGINQLKEMAKAADGNFINVTNQEQLNDEFGRTEDLSKIWSDWHGEKQGEIKDLHKTLSKQIHDWHDKMGERSKRQKDNLKAALAYLEEDRDFDFGPDSGLEFRQNRLGIADGIRLLYFDLDNTNRLSFISKSTDARMEYLENRD